MPAFRNVSSRHSGRIGRQIPVIYDKDGWEVPEAIEPSTCPDVKLEPLDVRILSPASPSADSSTSSSPLLCDPPFSNGPITVAAPSRKNSHSRRRDPTHIPRPRNAFILFRSDYIKRESSTGEGQQNELSKHAGKVWNKMSTQDKRPYAEKAAREKEEHYEKYPNYVYAPGRTGAKARPKNGVKKKSNGVFGRYSKKRKTSTLSEQDWSSSTATPSGSASPTPPPVIPPLGVTKNLRVTAQRALQRILPPSPLPPAEPSSPLPPIRDTTTSAGSERDDKPPPSPTSDAEFDYVPTSEIPTIELTQKEQEVQSYSFPMVTGSQLISPTQQRLEPVPFCYFDSFHSHFDSGPEHFGFKEYMTDNPDPTLPPLPRTSSENDLAYSHLMSPIAPLNLSDHSNSFQFTRSDPYWKEWSTPKHADMSIPESELSGLFSEYTFINYDAEAGLHRFFDAEGNY